jgi:hypothetical protein
MGSVGAPQSDEIGRGDKLDYRLAFGMMVLTNVMLMALTGTFSILTCQVFPLNHVYFSCSRTYLVDTT